MTIEQILKLAKDVVVPEADIPSHDKVMKALASQKNHKAVGYVNVERVCNYCHKKYTYNLLVGDTMMGACRKPGCILKSMRDNF